MHGLLLHPHQWRTYRFHHSIPMVSIKVTLFPHIFFFCAKGLSSMLQKATETQQLQGLLSCRGGVRISHFCLLMTPCFSVKLELGNVRTFYPFWRNMKRLLAKLSISKKLPCFLAKIPALR